MAKNFCPVSLLPAVSKIFVNLLSSSVVDHLEKCVFFCISNCDFHYGFRSSGLTVELFTFASDRIPRIQGQLGCII